ncbi:hypothetical protein I317_02301 [Kwoniella heveanensis CBS 569]|nr:hypothetical protein I317_02301 [Kwoniella heveanensis CBS 569]
MYTPQSARQQRLQYGIGPMLTQSNVIYALCNTRYTSDPEYVKAVLRSYVYFKVERHKTKGEISYKLELLERELPQFASSYRAIRQEYGLPASRVLPAARVVSDTSALRRTQTSATPSRPTAANPITRTHTTVGTTSTTTSRPARQQTEDDPPPPPYTSQDPEPEATRTLQERLALEAEATGSIAPDSPRASSTHHRTSSVSRYSPPATAPPHLAASTSSTSNQQTQRPEQPARPPSDPEMARIWEESQIEEAKRASIAAQREQEELEQALTISLAEAESRGQGGFAAASSEAGPSSHASTQSAQGNEGSSTHAADYNSDMRDLISGMEDMVVPGQWQDASRALNSASTSNAQLLGNDILDRDDGSSLGQVPLTPQKTGFAMKSKNPFLSPSEREHLEAEQDNQSDDPPLQSGHGGQSTLNGELSHIPQQNEQAGYLNAGSSRTYYAPPPQSPSEQHQQQQQPIRHEQFAPPQGRPPAHLRTTPTQPTSPSSRPLPATPKDQARRADPMSPQLQSPQAGSAQPYHSNMPSSYFQTGPTPRQASVTSINGPPPSLPPRPNSFVPPPGKEDALEMLREFDTVFLVDDSTSMAGERWSQARQALMEVAEIAARYDDNGVDIYFLNSKRVGKELKAAHEVEDLFRGLEPKGATPTGIRLEAILRDYMSRLERSSALSPGGSAAGEEQGIKAMNLIVVTDGAPTDDPESVLIACAKRLDKGEYPLSQVGVQFLQIGDDVEAREALQELDDGLSSAHGVRDIVDTVLYTGEDMSAGLIIKTLLGGINRRLDRRSSA